MQYCDEMSPQPPRDDGETHARGKCTLKAMSIQRDQESNQVRMKDSAERGLALLVSL